MKFITKLLIIALIGAFIMGLVSCTDNTEAENTTEVTESTAEPTPGTVYYPPVKSPLKDRTQKDERFHRKKTAGGATPPYEP